MKKLLFIFNPTAGKSRVKTKLVEILDIFVKAGYMPTAYPTQCREDAKNIIIKYANEYDRIVCCGGDGTLNEVVTGMTELQEKVPIVYIPAGSTNDYAKSLGIPTEMLQAAKMAVEGPIFKTDIGQFNDTKFVYVAAFGLFTDVSYQTSQELKNVFGHAAYVFEGVKSLMSIPEYHLVIDIDGRIIEDDFMYGMVSNTVSVGGFKNMTNQEVILDDGYFEALFVKKPNNPIQLHEVMQSLLRDGVRSEFVCDYKAKCVKINSTEPIAWTLDGEYGGEHSSVVIKNRANLISLVADTGTMDLSSSNHLKIAMSKYEDKNDSQNDK